MAKKTIKRKKPAANKTQQILGMLQRPNGASIPELIKATEWQAHSVRGFLAGTVRKKMGLGMILITHDLSLVSGVSDNIIVMYCGRVIERGSSEAVISRPAHPYTVGLLGSIPKMAGEREMLRQISGMVPNPFDMPAGCAFCPRCEMAQSICEKEYPRMREIEEGHCVCCHFAGGRGL